MRNSSLLLICALGILVVQSSPALAFSFANYNYYGRKLIGLSGAGVHITGTLAPTGAGSYSSGRLWVALDGSVCGFGLNLQNSSYNVADTSNGIGTETLNWVLFAGQPASCPSSFTDSTIFTLPGLGNVVRVADTNIGNTGTSGDGAYTN